MTGLVFTYGTLMFPEVMRAVTGQSFEHVSGTITGFAREGIRHQVFPGLKAAAGETTRGEVYFDVDETALAVLDLFEGSLYERLPAEVALDDGRRLVAGVWVVPPRNLGALDGEPWDPRLFQRTELPRYLDMCWRFREEELGDETG